MKKKQIKYYEKVCDETFGNLTNDELDKLLKEIEALVEEVLTNKQ